MSTFTTIRAIGIAMFAIMATTVASPAAAASDQSSKFAPANWPEETVYRPECRIVKADGSWLRCALVERD
jgi:hypothetical protein